MFKDLSNGEIMQIKNLSNALMMYYMCESMTPLYILYVVWLHVQFQRLSLMVHCLTMILCLSGNNSFSARMSLQPGTDLYLHRGYTAGS